MDARQIKDIRSRIDASNARGVRLLVAEESAWRASWPLVLVTAVLLNVVFAAQFMAVIAPPSGEPPVILGMNWSQLQNWGAAAALMIGCRVVCVFAEDARESDGDGWVRLKLNLLKNALVFFSIATAALGIAYGAQSVMDRGAAKTTAFAVAQAATQAERDAVASADAAVSAGLAALDDAQARADAAVTLALNGLAAAQAQAAQARTDWVQYQTDAKARYSGSDLAWVMNATHPKGPAKPYVEAIERADDAAKAAQGRVEASMASAATDPAVKAAQARVDALRGAAEVARDELGPSA